jgi:hypothetical protein
LVQVLRFDRVAFRTQATKDDIAIVGCGTRKARRDLIPGGNIAGQP